MTTVHALRCTLVFCLSSVVAFGCAGTKKPGTGTLEPGAKTEPAVAARDSDGPDAGAVITLGESYDYPIESDPIEVPSDVPLDKIKTINNPGVDEKLKPGLTLARPVARPNTSYPTDQQIIARLSSKRAYPGLGIGEDVNYVWRPTPDPSSRVWLVSTKPRKVTELKRSDISFSHGDPTEPRLVFKTFRDLVVYGICIDDPACGGHCGYTQ